MVTNAPQPPLTTTAYNPAFSDIVLEAYGRIQIRPTSLTAAHTADALRSAQLMLGEWQVRPNYPNLWKIQLLSIPLVPAVVTYSVPTNVVGILDYYIRQYQCGNPVNLAVALSTVINTPTVMIGWANHGLAAGQWLVVGVPISVGGLIIQGQYQVASVINPNTITITAMSNATGTVVAGGAVPVFTTTANSTSVNVALANHGLVPGNTFTVPISTLIGGLTLSGSYTVATYVDANNFTIAASVNAGATQTVSENGGLAQYSGQLPNVDPLDRVVVPVSRTDYSTFPDKQAPGFPSVVWLDRLINPTVSLYLAPDQNGPYVLFYYAMVQTYDVGLAGGATLDLPWRFLEAFAAGLAAKLAVKYPPPPPNNLMILKQLADESWAWASQQDSENVPMYIRPMFGGYYLP